MFQSNKDPKRHPTINRCLKHLSVLGADDKTKQIVYMYMEALYQDLVSRSKSEPIRNDYIHEKHP